MKKLILSIVILSTLLASKVEAQGGVGACPYSSGSLVAAYREMITVSNTAIGFTQSTWKPTDGRLPAVCATVVVNTTSISWWGKGATPTAADGIITTSGNSFSIGLNNLTSFLAIRATGVDSIIAVQYFTLVSP